MNEKLIGILKKESRVLFRELFTLQYTIFCTEVRCVCLNTVILVMFYHAEPTYVFTKYKIVRGHEACFPNIITLDPIG